jgi:hypothetical protein
LLATIRPNDWNLPLLLHVLGAMLLVGGLVTAVTALLLGWRRDAAVLGRLGFWALLAVAFPAYWLMRIGGEWTYVREGYDEDEDHVWIGIGFITADLGLVILVIALILTGIGARRLRRGAGSSSTVSRIGGVLAAILLAAYVVAVWAMTTKPD